MSDPALQLSGIAKTYHPGKPNAVEVLRGVDLTVAQGEVVALVAPSGAGKSTLLHIAGLLDTADAGDVRIAGTDMTGRSDRPVMSVQDGRAAGRCGVYLSVSPPAAGIHRTGKHRPAATGQWRLAQGGG